MSEARVWKGFVRTRQARQTSNPRVEKATERHPGAGTKAAHRRAEAGQRTGHKTDAPLPSQHIKYNQCKIPAKLSVGRHEDTFCAISVREGCTAA